MELKYSFFVSKLILVFLSSFQSLFTFLFTYKLDFLCTAINDFVTIRTTKIKLFRVNGDYPVIRGTLMKLEDTSGVLYTTGYIPYYDTYPGVHIPLGLQIDCIRESSLRNICKDILALTKINFNNCNYYDSLPITLRFAQKVGEIIQYLSEGVEPPNEYYFYM